MENELEITEVSYKNAPKVYGINDDWLDENHTVEELISSITSVDGIEIEAYKAKLVEVANRGAFGYIGRKGNITSVSGLLSQAYREIKNN